MKKVAINGPMNDRRISISSFLITALSRLFVDCFYLYSMDAAKIRLSPDELLLVQDAEILLTKNKIISSAYHLFGELSEQLRIMIQDEAKGLPAEMLINSPKISRGENYHGLPYVMLDYPRYFGKNGTCAIRTMMWWGNFFSTTLHISGEFMPYAFRVMSKCFNDLAAKSFYISIGADQWDHRFMEENYSPIKNFTLAELKEKLMTVDFCKIAAPVPVDQWNKAYELLYTQSRLLLQGLSA
jgi:hypothetical protein